MKKGKLFGIGLASVLSLASVGCSDKHNTEETGKAPMTERAHNLRYQNNREDISVSYIQREKDYVKSVNYLLSLYEKVIPLVKKDFKKMGIAPALGKAFTQCARQGELKDNSKAYTFADLVMKNYSGEDFNQWAASFEKAGQEAKIILSEGDSSSRRFVPATTTGHSFLRREIAQTNENSWKTAAEFESRHALSEQAKKYRSSQY